MIFLRGDLNHDLNRDLNRLDLNRANPVLSPLIHCQLVTKTIVRPQLVLLT